MLKYLIRAEESLVKYRYPLMDSMSASCSGKKYAIPPRRRTTVGCCEYHQPVCIRRAHDNEPSGEGDSAF